MCFFVIKQKTAYEMRISDWSSDVCSSDRGGIRPMVAPVHRGGGKNVTPKFLYGGADIRGALTDMAGHDGDPYEGVQIELVNPMTAGPVFPPLSYRAQLLRRGQPTAPFLTAGPPPSFVLQGQGYPAGNGQ